MDNKLHSIINLSLECHQHTLLDTISNIFTSYESIFVNMCISSRHYELLSCTYHRTTHLSHLPCLLCSS